MTVYSIKLLCNPYPSEKLLIPFRLSSILPNCAIIVLGKGLFWLGGEMSYCRWQWSDWTALSELGADEGWLSSY